MKADKLREWADYMDNAKLPRPDGIDPTAAPDMLEALKALVDYSDLMARTSYAVNTASKLEDVPEHIKATGIVYDSARAAIQKAEGNHAD
jgi:hypothetical protein